MQYKTINMITILFLILFQISKSIRINKKKFKPLTIGQTLSNDEISEKLSDLAISKLYERLDVFTSTSCRCTAKFILLAIGGIRVYDSLKTLNLTHNITEDLKSIREKLDENYIIQFEIRNNHHFIVFKKNSERLYLLQSFQGTYNLRDWMNSSKIMEPYLTIDNFLNYLNDILDPNIDFHLRNYALYSLFLPKEMSPTKKMKKKIATWFGIYKIELIHVTYQSYNFKENQEMNDFDELLDEVMENNISKHNGRWDLSKYSLYDLQQSKDSIKKDFKYRLNKILNLN